MVARLEVRFDRRLEDACDALAQHVRAARAARGPLDPVTLWVPSVTVGAYAKMALSRHLEIAAQIRSQTILSGLSRLGAERDPPLTLLGAPALRGAILAFLHDAARMAEPVMAPVARWIGGGDTQARRRSELAAQLAQLFDAYLIARPQWLAELRAGLAARPSAPDRSPTEAWQLALLDHALAATPALALPAFVDRLLDSGDLPEEIHVLGWSVLPVGVVDALTRLGERTQVLVYAPNPSRALWADPSIRRRELESVLLAESGRALRELVLTWSARTDQDAGDLAAPAAPATTLLGHLHNCLDEAQDSPWSGARDDSITVVAAPGVRREVEMVAQQIWRALADSNRADPPAQRLTLDRIAVYYVDREDRAYATHLDAVLGEAHELPRRLTDTPLSRETPVVGAVRALLDVPLGQRTRPEILGVLTHPLVRGRWPDVDAGEWLDWCAATGVIRGTDARDLEGSYVEGQRLYHWDQGLSRVALGTLGEGSPVLAEPDGTALLPPPIEGTRSRAAGRLVLLARSLLADARWAEEAELTVAEWVRFLGEYVAAYVTPPDQSAAAALRACLAAIAGCTAVDAGAAKVPYRVAHDLAVEAIDALTARRGAELAGGIHVAPLQVGRVVPFELVFVLGLDAARFPARARSGDLDLRPRKNEDPRAPQVTEVGLDATPDDRDRAAFLEVIGAARRRLVLSWESRDAITGEEKPCSPLVAHLLRWSRAVHEDGAIAVQHLPIRRTIAPLLAAVRDAEVPADAPSPLDGTTARAVRAIGAEVRAEALGRAFAAANEGRRPKPNEVRAAIAAAPESARSELEEALAVVPLPEPIATGPDQAVEQLRIPLARIRDFIACPLQGAAKFALQMEEDESDDSLHLDVEPLASGRFPRAHALRTLLSHALAELEVRQQLHQQLARLAGDRQGRGDAPTGVFGRVEQGLDQHVVEAWLEHVSGVLGDAPLRPVAFGSPMARGPLTQVLPPIVLEVGHPRAQRVIVTGQTSTASLEPRASVLANIRSGSDVRIPDVLRAFLDHVLLTLALGPVEAHQLHVLFTTTGGKVTPRSETLGGITVDEARTFLVQVVSAMLDPPRDVLFPIEAAQEVQSGGGVDQVDIEDAVDVFRERLLFDEMNSISSRYGPVRDPAARPAPDPDLAQQMMARLQLLFRSAPFLVKKKRGADA